MIHNIGIDIIEVDRIAKAIKETPKFVEKIFTKTEIAYCDNKKTPNISYAARFAAKEAFAKALQTGISKGICFTDIEVSNLSSGAPTITVHGKTKERLEALQIKHIFVSISHIKETSAAVVVLEK